MLTDKKQHSCNRDGDINFDYKSMFIKAFLSGIGLAHLFIFSGEASDDAPSSSSFHVSKEGYLIQLLNSESEENNSRTILVPPLVHYGTTVNKNIIRVQSKLPLQATLFFL